MKSRFSLTALCAASLCAVGVMVSRSGSSAQALESNMPAKARPGGLIGMCTDPPRGEVVEQSPPQIIRIAPSELGFFDKKLDVSGIWIKAAGVVDDAALVEAKRRIGLVLSRIPQVRANMVNAEPEFHIIGKDQAISALLASRGEDVTQTDDRDARARGRGGYRPFCSEENLLRLPNDAYRGYDIATHEFVHCLLGFGCDQAFRDSVERHWKSAIASKKWIGSYSATDPSEYFAEVTTWYFGAHGDLGMTGEKPANGVLRCDDPSWNNLSQLISRVPGDADSIPAEKRTIVLVASERQF